MNTKVIIRRPGGLDQIALVEETEPTAAKGEAKIRILAAGVAYGDILLRRGVAGGKFPVTPGYDLVGVVEALGPGASRFKVGDRIAAFPGSGAQQQFICLPEVDLIAVPPGVTDEKAVSIVLNYTTAYQLLTRAARAKTGDAVFIYGLAGGLGTAMQQVAEQLGVTVYGTARRGRLDDARRGGAMAFDRDDPDLVAAVKRHRPTGVDAVFDPVGGASLDRSYRLLAPGGTLVMLGAASTVQGDRSPKLQLVGTLLRFLRLKLRPGSRRVELFLITSSRKKHPAQFRDDVAMLFTWLKAGTIDPVIHAVLPLHDARQAQELLENSQASGKIVLQPQS